MRTFLTPVRWQNDRVAERFSTMQPRPGAVVARAADVLRRHRTAATTAGHVNVSPKGLRHAARARREPRGVSRSDRQRRRDDRASARERSHHVDGVRVQRKSAHLAPVRHRHGAPARHAGVRRARAGVPRPPGAARSIIDIAVDRVTTSCGYAVPLMDLVDDRDRLLEWAEKKGDDGIEAYWGTKNAVSIDGLPGIAAMTLRRPDRACTRARMTELDVDALLLSVGPDLPYLTGYEAMPLERLTMFVLPRAGDAQLVVPRLEAPRVERAARRCSRSCRGTRPTIRSRSSRG